MFIRIKCMMIDFMEREVVYERFVKGDEKALELLYDQYFATLGVYAGRFLREENVCVDIVHESFIKTWEKRKQFTSFQMIISFLYACVRNACLNELRHLDIKNKVLLQQASSLDIEGEIIEHEVKRIIWAEIARLAGDYKEIMAMSLEGYSTKEISEELNLSEQTIKNKKGEALKQLRKNMGPYQWCLRIFF